MKSAKILSMVAVLGMVASFATAAPLVTVLVTPGVGPGGSAAYDLYYTPGSGQQFTNARVIASTTGNNIYDPDQDTNKFKSMDGTLTMPIDTFANTWKSDRSSAVPSYIFNAYDPTTPDAQPVSSLDWSVYDSVTADNTQFVLARLLIAGTVGGIDVKAYDTASGGVATNFHFDLIPEPATLALMGIGGMLVALRRRRA